MPTETSEYLDVLGRSDAVTTILRVLSRTTGLRMALVARVTPESWTACAVLDEAGWGLKVGGVLDVTTTYCRDVIASAAPLVVARASADPKFRDHPGYTIHGIESYIAVPLARSDGVTFGVLCALDPRPTAISEEYLDLFELLAKLVTHELEADEVRVKLDAALHDAEAASRAKDVFLATLSHELRTPLNAILGWSTLLRAGTLSPVDAERALDVLERNAKAQARLIEDLLDMSRIVSGKVRLAMHAIDLSDVVAVAVEAARPSAETKGVHFDVTFDATAFPVSGDADRLQQVCSNLLSNALKFTPAGGSVRVRLGRVDGSADVAVTDTGQGIDPDVLPHVFGQFWQADEVVTRPQGGLGLGLAIVKHLVEMHGGTVRAESEGHGRGATFGFALPLAHDRDERAGPSLSTSAGESLDGPPRLDGVAVLVVDDVDDAQVLIRTVLEQRGAEVRTTGSVPEAMLAIEQRAPDLLISDIGMPDEDGFELIRKVRSLPGERGGRTPAVAVTAFARTEDRTRCLLAGFQQHLAKPIDARELCAVVAALTGKA